MSHTKNHLIDKVNNDRKLKNELEGKKLPFEDSIQCPKCGGTKFDLVASSTLENILFPYCGACGIFFHEKFLITSSNKQDSKNVRLFN